MRLENFLKLIFKSLLLFYIGTISVLFGGACRFSPSCSEYANTVLKEQGLFTALKLIIIRLYRCRPMSEFGFDFPPQKKVMHEKH